MTRKKDFEISNFLTKQLEVEKQTKRTKGKTTFRAKTKHELGKGKLMIYSTWAVCLTNIIFDFIFIKYIFKLNT